MIDELYHNYFLKRELVTIFFTLGKKWTKNGSLATDGTKETLKTVFENEPKMSHF